MRPWSGGSSPAMARSSVVFPLPEGPRSAITSPLRNSKETPFKMSFSPRRLWIPSTTRFAARAARFLFMEAHPQAQRDGEAQSDENDVDHGERRDRVHRSRRPERDDERADHFRSGAEQVDGCRVLAHEDHEDEQEAAEKPEADERKRDRARDLPSRGSRDERGFL